MDEPGLERLARSWRHALSGTSYTPLSSDAALSLLRKLAHELAAAMVSDPFDRRAGEHVGEQLVGALFSNPIAISRSADVMSRLPELLPHDGVHDSFYRSRLLALVSALGQGYAAALQRTTLSQQEAIRRAAFTAREQTEAALRASEERFRVVFSNAAAAIAMGDMRGRLVDANPALARMLGRPVGELRGELMISVFHPDDQPGIRRRVEQLVRSGTGTVNLEDRFLRIDGSYGWTRFAITVVPATAEREAYVLAVGEDVTERRELAAELYWQARHDSLTSLPNRHLLRERLERAIENAHDGDQVGLCFLDLDGFKDVNDRYGHGVGDRLLAAIAARLARTGADGDYMVARIGGDEFLALIGPPADADRAAAVAERMLAALTKAVRVDQLDLQVSASIGVAVADLAHADPETLLDAADAGLYRAKADGRGQWAASDARHVRVTRAAS